MGLVDRAIEQRLVVDNAARLDAAGCRKDQLRLGIVDAGREFMRREAAENYGVNRANARTGEHGDKRFRHHRHVDDDAITFADPEALQHMAEQLNLAQQFRIGQRALRARERGIVDQRRLVAAPGGDMAIEAVLAGVADTIDIPAAVGARRRIENGLRCHDPVECGSGFMPETLGVLLPLGVNLMIAALNHRASPVELSGFLSAHTAFADEDRLAICGTPALVLPLPRRQAKPPVDRRLRHCIRFPAQGLDLSSPVEGKARSVRGAWLMGRRY